MHLEKVTRFEVIDHTHSDPNSEGRILVRYGVKVEADLQDDGKTLKIFLTK